MAQMYNYISVMAFSVAGVSLIISIILFFKLHINSMVNLAGQNKKRHTEKAKGQIMRTGSNTGCVKKTALLDENSSCVKLKLIQNIIIVHTDEIIN